jgi:hypothetical protein
MKQSLQFLEGFQSFDMVPDQRPALDKLDNPRLLWLRLQMARYNFTPRWIPENHNIEADALSRSAISPGAPSDELGEGPQNRQSPIAMIAIIAESATSNIDITLEKVKKAAEINPVLVALRAVIREGSPNEKNNLAIGLRPYWDARHQLADTDDMIVFCARIVLAKIHGQTNDRDAALQVPRCIKNAPTRPAIALLASYGHRHPLRTITIQRQGGSGHKIHE